MELPSVSFGFLKSSKQNYGHRNVAGDQGIVHKIHIKV